MRVRKGFTQQPWQAIVANTTAPDRHLRQLLLRAIDIGVWWCYKACFNWKILTNSVPEPQIYLNLGL